jgi:hypothetical protein
MTGNKAWKLLGSTTLALGMMAPGAILAQQTTTPPPDQQQMPSAQSPADNPGQAEQQVQTFTGKLEKSKGKVVLKDESTKSSYELDNPSQAKQYLGKKVKVTGTLDPATNMIHVTDIGMASAATSY